VIFVPQIVFFESGIPIIRLLGASMFAGKTCSWDLSIVGFFLLLLTTDSPIGVVIPIKLDRANNWEGRICADLFALFEYHSFVAIEKHSLFYVQSDRACHRIGFGISTYRHEVLRTVGVIHRLHRLLNDRTFIQI